MRFSTRGRGRDNFFSPLSLFAACLFTLALALALALAVAVASDAANDKVEEGSNTCYDTSPKERKDGVINIHLICHTHDDVGWNKNVDEYYYGSNQNIRHAGVQYILDSVTTHLEKDPNRRFTYVEMAFFDRWWREASETQKESVRKLVENEQLTFANGGWCMHDEAAAHFVGMVDQTTRGHRFLLDNFNYVPKTGWQLDPFGHSATQAYLLGVDLGFDAMVLGRSDHADLLKRKLETSMEMMWAPSETFGTKKQILTQIRPDGNYGPPPCFCFDFGACACDPICDDERLEGYNVPQKVEEFIQQAILYHDELRGDDIMFMMGSDFQWDNANVWYKNLDKLIHYVNKDPRVNVFYSTPEKYFGAKRASNISFPLKTDDFFPYSDGWFAFWTGYFTSRPSSKRYIFQLTSFLQSARQVEYYLGSSLKDSDALDKLEDAVGTAMHHDAITGTEKQAVADDYARRLYEGSVEATSLLNQGFKEIVNKRTVRRHQSRGSTVATDAVETIVPPPTPNTDFPSVGGSDDDFVQCRLLNVSVCDFTELSSKSRQNMQIVVYNNLGQTRNDHVHLPIGKNSTAAVFDGSMLPVASQITELGMREGRGFQRQSDDEEVEELTFAVTIPPKGLAVYYVLFQNIPTNGIMAQRATARQVLENEVAVKVESNNVVLTFDGLSGLMTHYQSKSSGLSLNASIDFLVYNSNASPTSQRSGAYIFRPNGTLPILNKAKGLPMNLTLVEGVLFHEMRQHFAPWLSLSTRVYSSEDWVELLWNVGPIPFQDGNGKEISMRISSAVNSGEEFYTDSNGREMLKRALNYRPTWPLEVSEPVAGNYYPLTAALAIKDNSNEMSVLVDRACGGTSLNSGDLEFMLHRRILADDGRGVDEALNETECGCRMCNCEGLKIAGTNYLVLDEIETATEKRRNLQQKQQEPLVIAFRATDQMEQVPNLSGLEGDGLPANVNLMTFHALNSSSVLVRLAHMYQAGESKTFSTTATVDLSTLFPGKQILSISEMSLSANQVLSNMDYGNRATKVEGDYTVTVDPMQIKTFLVTHASEVATASSSMLKRIVNLIQRYTYKTLTF